MFKKKSLKNRSDSEFSALDDAVNELTRQTEALLGKAEDDSVKPVLPKKNVRPVMQGKSFDIIQNPKIGRNNAKLKTVSPASADEQVSAPEEHLLLADHAGKSYNEKEAEAVAIPNMSAQVDASDVTTSSGTPPIINHRDGKLSIGVSEQVDEEAEEVKPDAEITKPQIVAPLDLEIASDPVDMPETTPQKEISFEEDALQEAQEHKSRENESVEPDADHEENFGNSVGLVAAAEGESGELFANNLVKNQEPKGYKPHENQQKPTVFDTNEYHTELHDWSKLEHRSGAKVKVLIVLLVIGIALIYLVISKTALPF